MINLGVILLIIGLLAGISISLDHRRHPGDHRSCAVDSGERRPRSRRPTALLVIHLEINFCRMCGLRHEIDGAGST